MLEIKPLLSTIGRFIDKNSNHILTGLGAAGVITTAVWTGTATVKACDVIEKYEIDHAEYTTFAEKFKLTWNLYLPPVCMGITSIACIIGANTINCRRNAALAGLYSLTEKAFGDYREKVIEKLGEKKEDDIRDELIETKLIENPVDQNYIINTGKGNTLCFDVMSGRYFINDIENIRRIVNDMNAELFCSMWIDLNELYYRIGLEGVKMGEELGWTVDEMIDIDFRSKLTTDGRPCLVLDYDLTPKHLKHVHDHY